MGNFLPIVVMPISDIGKYQNCGETEKYSESSGNRPGEVGRWIRPRLRERQARREFGKLRPVKNGTSFCSKVSDYKLAQDKALDR